MRIQLNAPERDAWLATDPESWPDQVAEAERVGDAFGALLWRARSAAWAEHMTVVRRAAEPIRTSAGESLSDVLAALAESAARARDALIGWRVLALGIEVTATQEGLLVARVYPEARPAMRAAPTLPELAPRVEDPAPTPTPAEPSAPAADPEAPDALALDATALARALDLERAAGEAAVRGARMLLRIPEGPLGAVVGSTVRLRDYVAELERAAGGRAA